MNIDIEKPAICYETNIDESFLVGTKEELQNFAKAILSLLDEPSENLDYHGIRTRQPKTNRRLSENMSEIVLQGLLVVENKEERRQLVNKIRVNCGIDPIDWEGYDKRQSNGT